MYCKRGRVATLVAAVAVIGSMSMTSAASASIPLENWAVWGSLTDKKLNEPVILPKGSTLNGSVEIITLKSTEVVANLKGNLFVPPFKAKLKLGGLVPIEVGVTLTQVGEAEGKMFSVPPTPACTNAKFQGFCVTADITAKANIGLTGVGLGGIALPTHCETAEPVTLNLSATDTIGDTFEVGLHFVGTTTIPSIKCEGLEGIVEGPLITTLMSGPENPYSLHIASHEPAPPTITEAEALTISQVSARLKAKVNPNGEVNSDCHFEFGTTSSYGASVPCVAPPGSGFFVRTQLTGLSENTTYHYRVVATNPLGTSDGTDQTFTTLGEAGAPEYGRCVEQKEGKYADEGCRTRSKKANKGKFEFLPGPAPACVAQKKGEYTDATCTSKSTKPKKGTFEKAPGPGYTSTIGPVTLTTPGLGSTVTCAAGTAAGEITGAKTDVDRVTFTGCESSGKKCTSEGANSTPSGTAGVIVTNRLGTKLLGPVSRLPEAPQIWTQFVSSEHEPYVAEFGCEGAQFRSSGPLGGVQAGDIESASTASTTTFAPDEGEQGLSTERSEDGGKTWTGPSASSLAMVASNSAASQTDIRP